MWSLTVLVLKEKNKLKLHQICLRQNVWVLSKGLVLLCDTKCDDDCFKPFLFDSFVSLTGNPSDQRRLFGERHKSDPNFWSKEKEQRGYSWSNDDKDFCSQKLFEMRLWLRFLNADGQLSSVCAR